MGYCLFEHRSCVIIQPLYRDTVGWKVSLVKEKNNNNNNNKLFKKNQIKSNKRIQNFRKIKFSKNVIFVDKNALNVELIALHDL